MALLRPTTALRAIRSSPATSTSITFRRNASSEALRSPVNRLRNGVYGTAILGLLSFGYHFLPDPYASGKQLTARLAT